MKGAIAGDCACGVVGEAEQVEGLQQLRCGPRPPHRLVHETRGVRRLCAVVCGSMGAERVDRGDRLSLSPQDAGRLGVGTKDRLQHRAEVARVSAPGREIAGQEASCGVDHRLVDRLPPVHEVAEGLRHPLDVAQPAQETTGLLEEAPSVVGVPARQREVVEADPHRHSCVASCLQHRSVALHLAWVAARLLRLQPGPLQREAMVDEPVLGVELEVLRRATGEAVAVAGSRHPSLALPPGPVGPRCCALSLSR